MKNRLILVSILLLLVACNFIGLSNPVVKSSISTQVSEQLTSSPIVISTDTPEANPEISETVILLDTETPIPSDTPTVTLSPGDPLLRLGNPSWKETFEKTNQNFYQYEDDQTRFLYENGVLSLTAKQPNGWTGWSMSYPKPKNFYLEATMKTETCSGDDRYGLVFRAPDYEDGYFFGFNCDGKYMLRIYSQKGYLIPWTANPAINAGSNQVNRIGILAQNDRYAFYANGKLLQETRESTFTEAGLFGAFIASANTSNFTVNMEEIAFWNQ
jgi:hypothetical protein